MEKTKSDDCLIETHVRTIEQHVTNQEASKSLKELHKAAKTGISYRRWLKRFIFGFSLADSIERWVLKFSPSPGRPLKEQVPLQETRDVVSAWVRITFLRSIVLLLISSAITIVTAIFLYRQIIKQDELISVQENHNRSESYLRNIRTLYEEQCYKKSTITKPESERIIVNKSSVSIDSETEVCLPIHNYRLRAESLKALVNDNRLSESSDLSYAHIVDIDFRGDEMRDVITHVADALDNVNLSGANLQEIDFSGASLGHANLSESTLLGTVLSDSYMRGADLAGANLFNAKLNGANLHSANFQQARLAKADLSGADLSLVDFRQADLTDAVFKDAIFDCTNFNQSNKAPVGWKTLVDWDGDRCLKIRENRQW